MEKRAEQVGKGNRTEIKEDINKYKGEIIERSIEENKSQEVLRRNLYSNKYVINKPGSADDRTMC